MPDDALTTLGGYRLVRRLGSGSRADVYLGVGTSGNRALKIFRRSTARDDIGRELDALGRLDSDHCVRLVDVVSARSGLPAAILERVGHGSIAQLLRERESVEPGEAVTLLAPVVAAVRAAHHAGVAHTRIGASTIHLGTAGEPVLLGFGHVALVAETPSEAALDADPAFARDRDALASLAVLTLLHTRGVAGNGRATDLIEWLESPGRNRGAGFVDEFEARLFDLADPEPVELGVLAPAGIQHATVPGRVGFSAESFSVPKTEGTPRSRVGSSVRGAEAEDRPPDPGGLLVDGMPGWLHEAIATSPLALARKRLGRALRDVRKPFWIAAAAVALSLVAALALVPQGKDAVAAGEGRAGSAAGPVSTARPGASEARGPAATPGPATRTGPSSESKSSSSTSASSTSASEDPLVALAALLTTRSRCVKDRSVACLAAVDEQSSPSMATDTALIRALQTGAELPSGAIVRARAPTLIERLGDSALVALGSTSKPASALLIKEEAGWRIRSFPDGEAARSTTVSG